jgi:hypothetical protein
MSTYESHQQEGLEISNHNRAIDDGDFNTPEPEQIRKAYASLAVAMKPHVQAILDAEFGAGNVEPTDFHITTLEDFFGDVCHEYLMQAINEREVL